MTIGGTRLPAFNLPKMSRKAQCLKYRRDGHSDPLRAPAMRLPRVGLAEKQHMLAGADTERGWGHSQTCGGLRSLRHMRAAVSTAGTSFRRLSPPPRVSCSSGPLRRSRQDHRRRCPRRLMT